jgi:uncharacterized damage-inducible protein DinB
MEKYELPNDVTVFGFEVKTFPNGIGEAFEKLAKMLPEGYDRLYYGIAEMRNGEMVYKAATLENFEGEAEKYGLQTYTIEKGEYLAETVVEWTKKTACIKDVFMELVKDERAEKGKPCIEFYKNMDEMLCMVKVDKAKEMLQEFNDASAELIKRFSTIDAEQINMRLFDAGWTPAQVVEHVRKSYEFIAKLVAGPVKPTERDPTQNVELIKRDFADFTLKRNAPEIIVPESINYDKQSLITAYRASVTQLIETVKPLNLIETCTAFSFRNYGELTRMEFIYFAIYHTCRHTQQLQNIMEEMVAESE